MLSKIDSLRARAEEHKLLYKAGKISREEAKSGIMPFIDTFNEKSIKIAAKWQQKPKLIGLAGFLR